ncbi:MAG: hypothetical protein ACLFV5_07265 [Anaerolineales bacterium]
MRQRVLEESDSGNNFAICVPVIAETLFGIGLLPRAERTLKEWERLKPSFPCYAPDETDEESAAELQIALRHRGWQAAEIDDDTVAPGGSSRPMACRGRRAQAWSPRDYDMGFPGPEEGTYTVSLPCSCLGEEGAKEQEVGTFVLKVNVAEGT